MSGYLNDRPGYPEQGDNIYGWAEQDNQGSYNFDMSGSQFGQELNFQTFENTQSSDPGYATAPAFGGGNNPYLNPSAGQPSYQGEIFTPRQHPSVKGFAGEGGGGGGENFEDEPPLLEELGINPDHIIQKTLAVLNPFRATDAGILQDNDLAGPLVFCLIFGGLLLLSGKVHFSYIYGIGVMGCLAVYALLTLMSSTAVTFGNVVSVLGYCLLPMVGLSAVNVILSLQGLIGVILTGMAIFWCSLSASKLFVTALVMENQQILIAYPCALLYGVFALITIF